MPWYDVPFIHELSKNAQLIPLSHITAFLPSTTFLPSSRLLLDVELSDTLTIDKLPKSPPFLVVFGISDMGAGRETPLAP